MARRGALGRQSLPDNPAAQPKLFSVEWCRPINALRAHTLAQSPERVSFCSKRSIQTRQSHPAIFGQMLHKTCPVCCVRARALSTICVFFYATDCSVFARTQCSRLNWSAAKLDSRRAAPCPRWLATAMLVGSVFVHDQKTVLWVLDECVAAAWRLKARRTNQTFGQMGILPAALDWENSTHSLQSLKCCCPKWVFFGFYGSIFA